jgi:hypothetical protein
MRCSPISWGFGGGSQCLAELHLVEASDDPIADDCDRNGHEAERDELAVRGLVLFDISGVDVMAFA